MIARSLREKFGTFGVKIANLQFDAQRCVLTCTNTVRPETVAARLNLYVEETQPLLDHYGAGGMDVLKSFTGTESDVIYPLVEAHLLKIGIPAL